MKNRFYLYRKAWRFDGAPHEEPELQEQERKSLFKQGGLMIRNTYKFDCQEITSFWYLIKDQFNGLEELSGNTRKKVRRSLEKIEFRKVDNSFIKQFGYPILKASFDDYLVKDRITTPRTFENYLMECGNKDYDYWGIFDRNDDSFIGFFYGNVMGRFVRIRFGCRFARLQAKKHNISILRLVLHHEPILLARKRFLLCN